MLCKVRAWGSEVFISFSVLLQAKPAWLWMRRGNLLWLGMAQDQSHDEVVRLSAKARPPGNPASLLPAVPQLLSGALFPSHHVSFPVAWYASPLFPGQSSVCKEALCSPGEKDVVTR